MCIFISDYMGIPSHCRRSENTNMNKKEKNTPSHNYPVISPPRDVWPVLWCIYETSSCFSRLWLSLESPTLTPRLPRSAGSFFREPRAAPALELSPTSQASPQFPAGPLCHCCVQAGGTGAEEQETQSRPTPVRPGGQEQQPAFFSDLLGATSTKEPFRRSSCTLSDLQDHTQASVLSLTSQGQQRRAHG